MVKVWKLALRNHCRLNRDLTLYFAAQIQKISLQHIRAESSSAQNLALFL